MSYFFSRINQVPSDSIKGTSLKVLLRVLGLSIGLSAILSGCVNQPVVVEEGPVPAQRPVVRPPPQESPVYPDNRSFSICVADLRRLALKRGLSPSSVDLVFASIRQQPSLIRLDQAQAEFVKGIGEYVNSRVNSGLAGRARQMQSNYASLFARLESEYGIAPQYLLAFWGLETGFGANKGRTHVPSALATLACHGRRADFFSRELFSLIEVVQNSPRLSGHIYGSWAGAMGHTQFMPSTYKQYGRDGDGDGQVDLVDSPYDALTSAANYLSQIGWQRGVRWGREVLLPTNFNYQLAAQKKVLTLDQWGNMGVSGVDGSALTDASVEARLFLPTGHQGPAFLVYKNFDVIMKWNRSEAYALSVGLLADRIAGLPGVSRPFGHMPPMTSDVMRRLQRKLIEQGYQQGSADGVYGSETRAAIARYQAENGLLPDGYPSMTLLESMGIY